MSYIQIGYQHPFTGGWWIDDNKVSLYACRIEGKHIRSRTHRWSEKGGCWVWIG
jgi:hypothetical protein